MSAYRYVGTVCLLAVCIKRKFGIDSTHTYIHFEKLKYFDHPHKKHKCTQKPIIYLEQNTVISLLPTTTTDRRLPTAVDFPLNPSRY